MKTKYSKYRIFKWQREVLYDAECKKLFYWSLNGYVTKPRRILAITHYTVFIRTARILSLQQPKLNPIYFDDNKSDITARTEELDKQFM
jgi:hypothetical protein